MRIKQMIIKHEVPWHWTEFVQLLAQQLSKATALDTVDHGILLRRLSSRFDFGGVALSWFKSYLENRTQFVKIGNAISQTRSLDCGVPQESVLGQLFYLLYTAPLGDILRKHGLSFHLYADDSQIYSTFSCRDSEELAAIKCRIEICIADVNNWMTNWTRIRLSFSSVETVGLMRCGLARNRIPVNLHIS